MLGRVKKVKDLYALEGTVELILCPRNNGNVICYKGLCFAPRSNL